MSAPPSSAASPPPPPASAPPPVVHALLVCRAVRRGPGGEITLADVVEVLAVDEVPARVGPLCFVAFVRGLGAGPCQGAFRLSDAATGAPIGRLPLAVEVPAGFADRQVALQVELAELPVERGGWLTLALEWDGAEIARTRFAVGTRARRGPPAPGA